MSMTATRQPTRPNDSDSPDTDSDIDTHMVQDDGVYVLIDDGQPHEWRYQFIPRGD